MIKCVIHLADVHIRPYVRLGEYAEVLSSFVKKLKEITSTYERDEVRIVISGDLFESKNTISNELMTFSSFFLRKLEEIAKVLVLAGNHDLLLENTSRTDTLTALFDTAHFDDCMFLDRMLDYSSGVVNDDNVRWAVYSIYDTYRRPPEIDKINRDDKDIRVVGLYHGLVVGATMDNGSVIDGGIDGDAFNGCDCVMAGHIHKRQVLRKNGIDIVYPSSLIQQKFGETVSSHGFAVWNMEDMSYKFVDLETEYGLYNIEINSIDDIDNDKERLINF